MPAVSSDPLDGVRTVGPLRLGIVPLGLVVGAATVEQGLPVMHALGFSSAVFAGASQLAMIELLGADAPLATAVGTVVVINLRMMMYLASIASYFRDLTARSKAFASYLLTDQAYAVSIVRYGRDGETDRSAYYVDAGASLWLVWQVTTIAGALLGSGLPPEWGFDFAAPLVFLALLVPTLKDRVSGASCLIGGLTATGVVVVGAPFHLDIIVAVVVGVLVGLAVDPLGGDARMPTGYDSATVWLVTALTSVLTFVIRGSLIYLFDRIDGVSPMIEPASEYVPVIVFAVLVFPAPPAPSGDLTVSVGNDKLVAGVLAVLAVWYTERVLATTFVGTGVLWVLRFVV